MLHNLHWGFKAEADGQDRDQPWNPESDEESESEVESTASPDRIFPSSSIFARNLAATDPA